MDKKKQTIKESFKSSKVKYGGFATLVTIVVVVLLVGLNLLVDQIPGSLDMTQNRMFSLSQQTYNIIDNLDQEVRIIGLYPSGREDEEYNGVLSQYTDRSPYIKLSYVDPVANPTFSQKYMNRGEDIAAGDFIVETDQMYRIVKGTGLKNYTLNQYSYQYEEDSLAVEQQITSAMQYVVSGYMPKMYMIQGHGEAAFNGDVKTQVSVGNYNVEDLVLASQEAVPEDADMIVLNAPTSDISTYEAGLLRDYMANDGNLVVFFNSLILNRTEMPVLDELLKSYGLAMQDCIVIETDETHTSSGMPVYLYPVIKDHDITNPIREKGYQIGIYVARGIEILDQRRDTLDIVPLLTTSDDAYGETDYQNLSLDTIIPPGPDDIPGPINLAVAVTDHWYDGDAEHTSHLIVGSSGQIIQTISFGDYGSLGPLPGNVDFFMNSLGWLTGNEETISIRPVDLKKTPLQLTDSQIIIYAVFAGILIPLAAIGAGVYIWLKRRHL